MPSANISGSLSQVGVAMRIVLGVFLALYVMPLWAQSAPVITRITIQSYWSGYSPVTPRKTDFVIERHGNSYHMRGTIKRQKFAKPEPVEVIPPELVPSARVSALVSALQAPVQSVVDLKAIGLSQSEVQKAIDEAWQEAGLAKLHPPVRAKADALRESLRQSDTLAATITRGFAARHSDDYPYIAVKVEMSDGTTLTTCSTSQQAFMLPWKSAPGEASFNTAIPVAIQALLPLGDANRGRLSGPTQDFQLRELMGEGLAEQVGLLQAEDEAGPALRALQARFKVSSATPLAPFEGKGPLLAADLQLRDTPANLVLSTRLPLRRGALIADRHDIDRIVSALTLAQSAPALVARMKASPARSFTMNDRFGWEWLNARTARQFVDQMQAMGKLPELKAHPQYMQGAVMVLEGKRPIYWIVLPDHRAVLWKQYTKHVGGPGSMRCASVPMGDDDEGNPYLDDLCLGTVYDAEGQLQP
jgi:hypothetical protein